MEGKAMTELSPAAMARRRPLLTTSPEISSKDCGRQSRMGEAVGGCVAVCCCCPCVMIRLSILVVCLLPAALWRRKKRRRLLKKSRNMSDEEGFDRRKGADSRFPTSKRR
ncbi:hypothetical protein F511_21627 [Dorcoceras hygrometricum]|uniref:Uncharacterized protein n=1 Tax=Dorcoceras hygrometricum TaxID=472368 RepID=A0A2Z7BUQ5_9LAMI|nr:hypothetical protein F511_21627 [Dorcoceras hygrometricum]